MFLFNLAKYENKRPATIFRRPNKNLAPPARRIY